MISIFPVRMAIMQPLLMLRQIVHLADIQPITVICAEQTGPEITQVLSVMPQQTTVPVHRQKLARVAEHNLILHTDTHRQITVPVHRLKLALVAEHSSTLHTVMIILLKIQTEHISQVWRRVPHRQNITINAHAVQSTARTHLITAAVSVTHGTAEWSQLLQHRRPKEL